MKFMGHTDLLSIQHIRKRKDRLIVHGWVDCSSVAAKEFAKTLHY